MLHSRVDDAAVEHQISDRPIAVPGRVLRRVHGLVDAQLPAGGQAHFVHEFAHAGFRRFPLNHRGNCDGARIDHRVIRAHGLRLQFDGVEGIAARLDTYVFQRSVPPEFLQRHLKCEGLADGLNGKLLLRVPGAAHQTVYRRHGNAEVVGICLRKFGNVSCYFSLINIFVLFVNVLDDFLDVRKSGHVSPR